MSARLGRKLAKIEGTQEIEEMTSEKRRGRMVHATARIGNCTSDAKEWTTRPRGKAKRRMTRTRE